MTFLRPIFVFRHQSPLPPRRLSPRPEGPGDRPRLKGVLQRYGTFRLDFHHLHRFELDLRGHTRVRGAALPCPRFRLADMVAIQRFHGRVSSSGTSACFIFELGPGSGGPLRFGPTGGGGAGTDYILAHPLIWPVWGFRHGFGVDGVLETDLSFGLDAPPPEATASAGQGRAPTQPFPHHPANPCRPRSAATLAWAPGARPSWKSGARFETRKKKGGKKRCS